VAVNPHQKYVDPLRNVVVNHVDKHGATMCAGIDGKARELIVWLEYLRASADTGHATVLLGGVKSAILEVAACLSLGLVRPAMFSLRAQVDMMLAWLYFKDHPIEWKNVEETGDGYKLKKELLRYLSELVPRFTERNALLQQVKSRKLVDPYRVLSAHVHSQSTLTVPNTYSVEKVISTPKLCLECIELQYECAEFLSDVLLSCYADKWASLPDEIVNSARKRMSAAQEKAFFT